jgi:hypothetical protein
VIVGEAARSSMGEVPNGKVRMASGGVIGTACVGARGKHGGQLAGLGLDGPGVRGGRAGACATCSPMPSVLMAV